MTNANGQHENMVVMAAAYALDALDAPETAVFEAHLPTCPECAQIVGEMRSVVAALPLTVPFVDPPADLKQRVFDRVHALQSEQSNAHTIAPASLAAPEPRHDWRDFFSIFSGGGFAVGAAVASLALLLVTGSALLRQRDQITGLQGQLVEQQLVQTAASSRHQQQIAQLQGQLAQREGVQALINSPDGQVVQVHQSGIAARLFTDPKSERAYIVIDGLPEAPQGRDYQIWLSPDGKNLQPVSVGVFRDNSGRWLLEADKPLSSYGWIGVTEEPDGGSPAPTSKPLMGGEFQPES
ncbi:MAG: anti-sigma factor [Chloroflexia bacterium]|nr:anti-sigma factor [Chloroflexia bacterium]